LFASAYSLWMVQRTIHGPNEGNWQIRDLVPREALVFAVLIAATITLGLYPQPVLNTAAPSLAALRQAAGLQSPGRPAMAPTAATSPGASSARQSTGQGGQR
ncbi:MAG TPA: NADH-quinone oxidoreductase subunit M, partial [Chloroflexota bacterium]|nr:NADH-quinone oxidoreductase subunit M [Chloroflexota bacterium]